MKRAKFRKTPVAGVAIAALASGLVVAPGHAEETALPQPTQTCPLVHLVMVNGTGDSALGLKSTEDSGWMASQIGAPMTAQLNGEDADPSAGISVEEAEAAQKGEQSPAGAEKEALAKGWDAPADVRSNDVWPSTTSATPSVSSEQTAEPATIAGDDLVIGRTYIPYPSSMGGAYVPVHTLDNAKSYEDSVAIGVERMSTVLKELHNQCPDTKAFLVGYSQGAEVASAVARKIGNGEVFPEKDVAGVALFADPTRDPGTSTVVSGASVPAAVPGTEGEHVSSMSSFTSPELDRMQGGGLGVNQTGKDFGRLADRTVSWCTDGDLVCDMPVGGALKDLVVGTAEGLNITDPEASIAAVSDVLNPAVSLAGPAQVTSPIDFGAGGFSTTAASKATKRSQRLSGLLDSGLATATGALSTGSDIALGATSPEDAVAAGGAMGQQAVGAAADVAADIARDVVVGVGMLGGMGFGAGLGIAREMVNPANLAELAAAGASSPETAALVAGRQLQKASTKVLTSKTAVGQSAKVFDQMDVMGLTPEAVSEAAIQSVTHGSAHMSYPMKPLTSDGGTAVGKTREWITATAADLGSQTAAQRYASGDAGSASMMQSFNTDMVSSYLKGWLHEQQGR